MVHVRLLARLFVYGLRAVYSLLLLKIQLIYCVFGASRNQKGIGWMFACSAVYVCMLAYWCVRLFARASIFVCSHVFSVFRSSSAIVTTQSRNEIEYYVYMAGRIVIVGGSGIANNNEEAAVTAIRFQRDHTQQQQQQQKKWSSLGLVCLLMSSRLVRL